MILILLFFTVVAAILFAVFFIRYWQAIFWTMLIVGIVAVVMFVNELRGEDPDVRAARLAQESKEDGVPVR